MAGGVFLEKKARLRWLDAYFSRKRLDSDAWGRISREKGWTPMAGGIYVSRKDSHAGRTERISREGRQKGYPERIARQDGQKGYPERELEGIGREGRQKGEQARIAMQDGQKW